MPKNAVVEWSHSPDGQVQLLKTSGRFMQPPKGDGTELTSDEPTELELRLLEWIKQSDFETVAWSTAKAAKSFKVKQSEIYEALAALTRKLPKNIQIYYENGNIHVAAE